MPDAREPTGDEQTPARGAPADDKTEIRRPEETAKTAAFQPDPAAHDATDVISGGPGTPSARASSRSGRLKPREARIAMLAVESEMASDDDVRACQEAVLQRRAQGEDTSLELALIKDGVLTESQLKILLSALNKSGEDLAQVGPYIIDGKIGEGGMGAVYKAHHETLGRVIALKALPEALATDPEVTARFIRESQTAVKIEHENVVHVYDAGEADDTFFIAMEYVDGPTLEDEIQQRGRLPQEEALAMAIHITRALDVAHKAGLVHRDIKPGNILFNSKRVAKLADLGLAKQTGGSQDTQLTQAGYVMGTPNYISPEQSRGKEVDIRSDLFSFGATLYRAVTGEFPYKGDDAVSLIMARFTTPPKPANEVTPQVSGGFARVLALLMAVDKKTRYPTPAVLMHDLELLAQGKRPDFASGHDSQRRRAVKLSETRSFEAVTGPVIVTSRRRRETIFVAIGVLVVAALVVTSLLLGGQQQTLPLINNQSGDGAATEAQKELQAKAKAFYEDQSARLAAGDHAAVAQAIKAAGDAYATTAYASRIDSLLLKASAIAREEQLRREADQRAAAERARRVNTLLNAAREELASNNHSRAVDLALQAQAIADTEAVRAVLASAKRGQHLKRAADALRADDLDEAVRLYRLALEIEDTADVQKLLAAATNRRTLQALLTETDQHVENNDPAGARTKLAEATAFAGADAPPAVRDELSRLDTEVRYLELLMAARTENWQLAIEKATAAAKIKPDAAEPEAIIRKARKALGPPRVVTNSIGMEFVFVPGGAFTMGSDSGDDDEKPASSVQLSGYYIGRHEVTNEEYDRFVPGHSAKWGTYSASARCPAIAVTWHQAKAFCAWLTNTEGITYRLPTEAEWERAARGTDARRYPWGANGPAAAGGTWRCNYAPEKKKDTWGRDGFQFASPVGRYPAGVSATGCHDMAGNVWEWCRDWYAAEYYASRTGADPAGPTSGEKRVLRGGSFTSAASVLRASNRYAKPPEFFEANVGFRVVRELDELYRDD